MMNYNWLMDDAKPSASDMDADLTSPDGWKPSQVVASFSPSITYESIYGNNFLLLFTTQLQHAVFSCYKLLQIFCILRHGLLLTCHR